MAGKWYPKSVVGVSETDLAYAAGIIDGEGSIGIHVRRYPDRPHLRPNYCMRVAVLTTDSVICPWMQKTFGGALSVYVDDRTSKKASKGLVRRWSLSMKSTAGFLAAILPYLKLKRKRAELAIHFCSLLRGPGGNTPISEENMHERFRCMEQMHALNRKRKAA